MKLNIVIGEQHNPYLNLAIENYLTDSYKADTVTLFLWKNQQTVVIGTNQNPFTECNVDLLIYEGGHLARRRTGGGAVYHDLGNLNFSFIADKANYDVTKQCSVIQEALREFGLNAVVSGRNDILLDGRKFSGNAFYSGKLQNLHHGTLLIKTDTRCLQKYLKVNPAKLQKHGVKSVSSRIINLSEIADINSNNIVPALIRAFESTYHQKANTIPFSTLCSNTEVLNIKQKIESNDFLFGKWKDFQAKRKAQFEWGLVEIDLHIDELNHVIQDISIATDSLQVEAIHSAEQILRGADIHHAPTLADDDNKVIINDIFSMIY